MSSNLCTEIVEYSDTNETAVCNLASIGLPMYVKDDKTFDYNKLYEVTKIIVRNLKVKNIFMMRKIMIVVIVTDGRSGGGATIQFNVLHLKQT